MGIGNRYKIVKKVQDGSWLIQQAKLPLIKRNRSQLFGIFRLRWSHHTTVLKNKVHGQTVRFEVAQSQNGGRCTQLPCDGGHDLPEKLIKIGYCGTSIQSSAQCFVRFR